MADVSARPARRAGASTLSAATLRVGSVTVACRLAHAFYAERLIEFFKGNLEPAGDAACDASLSIRGVPYDPVLFPGDESSYLHAIAAETHPGGFSLATCL